MKEQLISYGTALLAKDKGFNLDSKKMYLIDGSLITYHENTHKPNVFYIAPTQSLLQKWLYETHKLWVYVEQDLNMDRGSAFRGVVKKDGIELCDTGFHLNPYNCMEKIMQKALKIVK